jgi:hypothetical protein
LPANCQICSEKRTKPEENRKKPVETRLIPLTIERERLIVNCGAFPNTRINTGDFAATGHSAAGVSGSQGIMGTTMQHAARF